MWYIVLQQCTKHLLMYVMIGFNYENNWLHNIILLDLYNNLDEKLWSYNRNLMVICFKLYVLCWLCFIIYIMHDVPLHYPCTHRRIIDIKQTYNSSKISIVTTQLLIQIYPWVYSNCCRDRGEPYCGIQS